MMQSVSRIIVARSASSVAFSAWTAILAVGVIFCCASFAEAQEARNGSAAAPYLLIPQGVRYLSGGGAAANVNGIESVFWNPAGLARTEKSINVMFSRKSYIADININFAGASLSWEGFGSLALSLRSFDIGDIPVTTVFFPDGTGELYEPNVFVVGVAYSRLLTDRTSVGLNLNILSESFPGASASGNAFDVGLQYTSFLNITNLSIGVVLKNFGSAMRYDGSRLFQEAVAVDVDRKSTFYKVEAAVFDLPSVIDLATSYRIDVGEANSLDVGVTFQNNQSAQDEYQFMATYMLGDMLALRGSYLTSESEGALENIFASYSFGGTLNLQAFTGADLSIDYGYIDTDFFDAIQVFSVRFGF